MKVELKRELFARSNRVKGVDQHPTEPWILTTLYSGHVYIWSFATEQIVKSFELTHVPVRAGRFIARKQWIICGSDDYHCRVYNWNTSQKVASWEAHPDYIRAIAVHPTLPYVLTASDDMTIRMWDWEHDWKCVREFTGHTHYVMSVAFNPKDTNTFASACLDRTVKIWNLSSSTPNMSMEAHDQKGVNYVDYYPHSDNPYLVTTSDDRTIKVWDYTSKALISTLEGHSSNVSFAVYHPKLPIIISGSEDGSIKLWNAKTYKLEESLNYGLDRAWCVSAQRGRRSIAMGFDNGSVVVKMGGEEPMVSMDSLGNVIWAGHSEVSLLNIKRGDKNAKDGLPITIPPKEHFRIDPYPKFLAYSPNKDYIAVRGEDQYHIYNNFAQPTTKTFGSALDFVWASKDNHAKDYAIRESSTAVKVFRYAMNKPFVGHTVESESSSEGLTGGYLLGVKRSGGISFVSWGNLKSVGFIEQVSPRKVYWSEEIRQMGYDEDGQEENQKIRYAALACDDTFYVFKYRVDSPKRRDGERASPFEQILISEEVVVSGQWVGACFIYTNTDQRLNYLVGQQTETISHFDSPYFVLGYLDERVYICDEDFTITSYALSSKVLQYLDLVLRGEMEIANEMLPEIGEDHKNKLAHFLEKQGHQEEALSVAVDPEHRFKLALDLNNLDIALELAQAVDVENTWSRLGDSALKLWDLALAEKCYEHAKDLKSLLLMRSASCDAEGLRTLAKQAEAAGQHNIAFLCYWQLGDTGACHASQESTGRTVEAALFAQTYAPSKGPVAAGKWRKELEDMGRGRIAKILGMPPGVSKVQEGVEDDADMFPEWDEWLKLEEQGKPALIDIEASNGTNGDAGGAEHEAVTKNEVEEGLKEIEAEAAEEEE